jgi:sugar phosphate permease
MDPKPEHSPEVVIDDTTNKHVTTTEKSCYFPYRFIIVSLLHLCNAIYYLQRNLISIAIIPISQEYKWDPSIKGYILAAFNAGYMITQIPGGYASKRFSGKWTLVIIGIMRSIFILLFPLSVRLGVGWAIATLIGMTVNQDSFIIRGWLIEWSKFSSNS